MLVVALVLVLPLSAFGQDDIPNSFLDLTVTPAEDGGVTTTWRVPEGKSPEFSYFYLDYTRFNSYHYGFWKTFHISNSDVQLNTTTNQYSYYHAGFTISYDDYINSNYVGNGSYLISVIGYTGQAYWFSDEVLFTPGISRSSAAFELKVARYDGYCNFNEGDDLRRKLLFILRSLFPGFVRRRGIIEPFELICFQTYGVFRGVISLWGEDALRYREQLHQWMNEETLHGIKAYNGWKKIRLEYYDNKVLLFLTDGPCGYNITSIDSPYCEPVDNTVTAAVIASTDYTMAIVTTTPHDIISMTPVSMATHTPTPSTTFTPSSNPQSTTPQSDGSSAALHVTMAVACIAIVLSMLVVVGLVLYIVVMKRKKNNCYSKQERSIFAESPLYANNRLSEDPGLVEETALDDNDKKTLC